MFLFTEVEERTKENSQFPGQLCAYCAQNQMMANTRRTKEA